MRQVLLSFILLALFASANAQQTDGTQTQSSGQTNSSVSGAGTSGTVAAQSAPAKTSVTVLGGLVYAPHLHYYGRTDAYKSSALLPTLSLELDSVHIYATVTSVFIHNKFQSEDYAGTIIEAGYRFGNFNHFSGNVYANKFFYNTGQLPQSALKEQAGANLSLHTQPINFTATGSAAFSDARTDFFTSVGVNKGFKWKFPHSLLLLTPTYVLNMGSQNFTTINNQTGQAGSAGSAVEQQSARFKILDHEVSVPIVYALKHFYFIATPSYIRPESVVTVPGHPEFSETAEKLFYINLTVLFTFKK